MASQERGVYQPQEDFASYEDYPEEEGRSRLPLMIVIALVVLAAFGGVVWLAYNQGVEHGRAGAPPHRRRARGAGAHRAYRRNANRVRHAVDAVHRIEDLWRARAARRRGGKLCTRARRDTGSHSGARRDSGRIARSDGRHRTVGAAAATAAYGAGRARTADAARARNRNTHACRAAAGHACRATARDPRRATARDPRDLDRAGRAGNRGGASRAHAHAGAGNAVATATAPRAIHPPATHPAPAHTEPATEPPPQVAAVEPPPTPVAPAATHSGGAATSGKAVLQIGSYTSEALATAAWRSFQSKHGGALTGLSSDVARAQIPGKGTWYRLRIGPFASRTEANTKCAQLKTQGMSCLVASP